MLRHWTTEDVANWLVQIGLQQYREIFRLNAIDGIELLNLNDAMLAGALAIGEIETVYLLPYSLCFHENICFDHFLNLVVMSEGICSESG